MISEFVQYVKQAWKNKPNVSSPLNADRLNHMEDGIENNSNKIKEIVPAVNELTEKSGEYTYSCILGKYYANFAYTFVPFPNNGETITLKSVKTWDNFTEITLTDFSIDKTTKDGFAIRHESPTYIGNMVDIHFKVSN